MRLSKDRLEFLYRRLGMEIELIRYYTIKILCDKEYQEAFIKKDLAHLKSIDNKLSKMKSDLEIKMYQNGYMWKNPNVFYGNSHFVEPIIQQIRDEISQILNAKEDGGK